MTDPINPGGVSVTVKGEGKDLPWMVFHGAPETVLTNLSAIFGDGTETLRDVPSLAAQAHVDWNASINVAKGLGGRVLSIVKDKKADETPAEEDPRNGLLAEIAAITDPAELPKLWAANKAAFEDADLLAAWKARGKELTIK